METELKLLVPLDALHRLRRHPALAPLRAGRARSENLYSVYYDTPDRELAAARVALRVRREGRRWVQTLKGGGSSAGGLHARDELEWTLAGEAPDLDLLETSAYAGLFRRRRVREALAPVFVTAFARSTVPLAFPDGTRAELATDVGELRAGDRKAPICEVEIELKSGAPDALFDLAGRLAGDVPIRLGFFSKAERGYALADGRISAPRKASRVALAPEMTAAAALRAIALACIGQMQANEEGFLAGKDPEFLHQLRVGSRRLRSCLGLLAMVVPKAHFADVVEDLRWLASVLGPARDWDVFATETLPPLAREFAAASGMRSLRASSARLRARHNASAREALGAARYARLMLRLGAMFAEPTLAPLRAAPPASSDETPDDAASAARPVTLDTPAADFAAYALDRRDRRVRKLGPGVPEATPAARHEVRIAAKKLRYAAEFFGTLYGRKRVQRYVASLATLQDILGALNDAATVERLLGEIDAQARRPLDPQVAGIVRGWFAAVARHGLDHYAAPWARFEKAKPFWR